MKKTIAVLLEDLKINKRSGLLCLAILLTYRIGHSLFFFKESSNSKTATVFYKTLKIITSAIHRAFQTISGSSIPFSAKIGRGIKLPHGFSGIYISSGSVIGDDVTILHQVTIGSNIGSKNKKASPTIGNRVLLGAGSKVIGNISIGDESIIGINAVVVKDMPPNHIAHAPEASIKNNNEKRKS